MTLNLKQDLREYMALVAELRAEVERLKEQVASLQASSGYEASIAQVEIERLEADMAQIATIANIPPADERYGSLAVRMEKIWLLSR